MGNPRRRETGLCWQEMHDGLEICTSRRTIEDADLHAFRGLAGFYEPLFMDRGHAAGEGLFDQRPIPAALTMAISEGLVILSGVLNGTGLAFLGMKMEARLPVLIGDTITVHSTVIESRASSKGPHCGVVVARNVVSNQRDETVMVYEPVRLIKGVSGEAS